MKKSCLITTTAVFMLFFFNGIQAETTQTKLDQVEMMKQFLGSWKCDLGNDTVSFTDIKQYEIGFEVEVKYVSAEKIIRESKQILGYDKEIDKWVGLEVIRGAGIFLYSIWFTSETNYESVHYSDNYNPDKAFYKSVGEFKSSDLEIEAAIINGKPVRTEIWTRLK